MKIERRIVDAERGIMQITTSDERFYLVQREGEPDIYYPSVTWICGYYHKGVGFLKFIADKGWDEAEAVKQAAGEKGSRVHRAISDILMGKTVKIDDKYADNDGNEPKELTAIEYEAIMSFVRWADETQPEILAIDYTLVEPKEGYAGTIDIKCKINGEIWIVDIKTSANVYMSHEIQVSAYKHADKECQKIAILQVGYARNKAKFKFTEIEDQYPLFLAAKAMWAKENKDVLPSQKDFPLELKWSKLEPAKGMAKISGPASFVRKIAAKKKVVKRRIKK